MEVHCCLHIWETSLHGDAKKNCSDTSLLITLPLKVCFLKDAFRFPSRCVLLPVQIGDLKCNTCQRNKTGTNNNESKPSNQKTSTETHKQRLEPGTCHDSSTDFRQKSWLCHTSARAGELRTNADTVKEWASSAWLGEKWWYGIQSDKAAVVGGKNVNTNEAKHSTSL